MRTTDALFLFDNPIAGRDLRSNLSPRRLAISVTAHALSLFVATLLASFAQATIIGWLGWFGTMVPFGRVLLIVLTVIEILFFTIFIPARLAAVISHESRHNCLDQLVLTGVTPWTLFSGKLGPGLAYAAILFCSSVPFFGLCWVFGGVSLSDIALVYLLLATYVTCLACVTTALGISVGSIAAALLVILLGMGLFVAGFAWQLESAGAALCVAPTRVVMVELVGQVHPAIAEEWPRPALMGAELPFWVLATISHLAMGSIAMLSLLAGPSASFAPGLNNFDSASCATRRRRLGGSRLLLRSIQLAFLYENGHHLFRRYARLIRALVGLAIAAFLLWLTASTIWMLCDVPYPWTAQKGKRLESATLLYARYALLYLLFVTFCTVHTKPCFRADRDSRPRSPVALDSLCFCLKLAMPVAIASLMVPPAVLPRAFWTAYAVGAAHLLALYVLIANVSLRVQHPPVAVSWACGLAIAFTAAPFVWYPLFACGLLPASVAQVAQVSPLLGLSSAAEPGTVAVFTNFFGPDARVVTKWAVSMVANLVAICLMLVPLVLGLRLARSRP